MTESYDSLRPRDDLGVKEVDDDLLVLDKHNENIHQLNATARLIWTGLGSGQTVNDIAQQISQGFDISTDAARDDVCRIIKQLLELGLLRRKMEE